MLISAPIVKSSSGKKEKVAEIKDNIIKPEVKHTNHLPGKQNQREYNEW
jgi:hypothetical protein